MSTQKENTRRYELKARAESQERTRRRIAKAAAELHGEVGPAKTTVAEIARRAGVSRLTVYKHFPDNAALYPACSEHHRSEHPPPDFAAALAPQDPVERTRSLLRTVYGEWYPSWRRMLGNLLRDRGSDPALDEFMSANLDVALAGLADQVTAGYGLDGPAAERVRALAAVALDFWTWERLTGERLDDAAAADLMAGAIAAAAGSG